MFNVFLVQGDIETPIDNDHGMGLTVTAATITDLLPWHNYTVKVFCGNVGGFEMGGRETTFTTDIPPPSGTTEGEVSDTMVELSWAVDSLHLTDWYRIEYEMVSGGGKRAAATTVFASQLHGTSVNVTGLVASSTYTIFIYAGKGASYYEPHGTSITVTTLISSGNQANGGLPLGAIIGIIIGGLALVAAVAVAFFILVVRQNRKTASIKRIISQEMSLRSSSSDPRPSIGERRASRVSEGTLLNTNMEISVPGFLLLDAASQFRVEGPLGRGGTATVFKGVLLDADLIQQHATKNIALKRVDPQEKLSGEENKERFLSEVSLMWTCAFHQNVAKFIGFTYEPHKYIVTKLYELDLYTFIHHPTEALPSILALKLSGDISCAVSYMQDMGIVHRDLKTQNILLEEVTMNEKESYLKHRHRGGFEEDEGGRQGLLPALRRSRGVCQRGLRRPDYRRRGRQAVRCVFLCHHTVGAAHKAHPLGESCQGPNRASGQEGHQGELLVWFSRACKGGELTLFFFFFCFFSLQPEIPQAIPGDEARQILLDMMVLCWNPTPSNRPTFAQLHQKITSLF